MENSFMNCTRAVGAGRRQARVERQGRRGSRERGKPRITDGPFAETKEQLGGYQLIECMDRDEAVAIALSIPTLPVGGSIEVRPLVFQE
jgi:hypothetical protein